MEPELLELEDPLLELLLDPELLDELEPDELEPDEKPEPKEPSLTQEFNEYEGLKVIELVIKGYELEDFEVGQQLY